MLLEILIVVLVSQWILPSSEDCSQSILGIKDIMYVLSDEEADANTARNICQSSKGQIPLMKGKQTKAALKKLMNEKYTKDMEQVHIYINSNWYTYKYYIDGASEGKTSFPETEWNSPGAGELSSFKLFKRPTGNFTHSISFCWFHQRDKITNNCTDGWKQNFELFGGHESTNRTIRLYNFYRIIEGKGCSQLLFSNSTTPLYYERLDDLPVLYIPDTSVFIGARSREFYREWFWSDGTEVANPKYPLSENNICQQMSLPLTFDDGINLSPKKCSSDRAFFACQFKFHAWLLPIDCNATKLQLLWNSTDIFQGIIADSPNLILTIHINKANFTEVNIPYNKSQFIISGLLPRTNYSAMITVKEGGCEENQRSVVTTVEARTGYGVPDAILAAQVGAPPAGKDYCVIVWSHDPSDKELLLFKIIATSNHNTTFTYVEVPPGNDSNNGQELRQVIELFYHGYKNYVYFQLQVSSCEGESEIKNVKGFCISTGNPSPSLLVGLQVGIGLCIIIILFLLFILACILLNKRYSNILNMCTMGSNENQENSTARFGDVNQQSAIPPTHTPIYHTLGKDEWRLQQPYRRESNQDHIIEKSRFSLKNLLSNVRRAKSDDV